MSANSSGRERVRVALERMQIRGAGPEREPGPRHRPEFRQTEPVGAVVPRYVLAAPSELARDGSVFRRSAVIDQTPIPDAAPVQPPGCHALRGLLADGPVAGSDTRVPHRGDKDEG